MINRKFILSYVNEADATKNYDATFDDMFQLMAFVDRHHPEFTSYQVIVIPSSPDPMTTEKAEALTRRAT